MHVCEQCKKPLVKRANESNWRFIRRKFCNMSFVWDFTRGVPRTEEVKRKISLKNWKNGNASKNKQERIWFKRTLQKRVFQRDDYTCQICGVRGVDLQVDHILPWATHPEERFNMKNCRTLCAKCHYFITFGRKMPSNIKGWGHNLMGGALQ